MSVVIETTVGDITVDLYIEERPLACLNFIKLCKLKYYNYNLFHTIEQDFIAQTGDPTGAGDGGTSVWGVIEGPQKRFFEAESLPKLLHTSVGLLSFVSPGKNLVGSQFFFTLGADLTSLDGQHCVIGEVVEGHETLRRLNEAIVDDKYRPYQDIRITHTVILEDPFPDMRGFRAPSRSPSPTADRLQNGRIAADEDIDDTEGKSMEEIQEMLAEREAKARATILEIVGDLPDAEAAPPENVLFVCKLNPVTTEDDLEIIFSRFGKVVSCEVIRDKKTGDSLQYAFVEFDNEKSCEAAYFKMNNVLIDDRRIHVDFSQSVARVKWRGKGRGVEGQQGRLDFKNLREPDRNTKLEADERRKAREERHKKQDVSSRENERNRYDGKQYEARHDRYRDKNDYNRRQESPRRNREEYNGNSRNRNQREDKSSRREKDDAGEKRYRRETTPDRRHRPDSRENRRKDKSSERNHRDKTPERKHREEFRARKIRETPERRRRNGTPERNLKDSPKRKRRDETPERKRRDSPMEKHREDAPERKRKYRDDTPEIKRRDCPVRKHREDIPERKRKYRDDTPEIKRRDSPVRKHREDIPERKRKYRDDTPETKRRYDSTKRNSRSSTPEKNTDSRREKRESSHERKRVSLSKTRYTFY